MKTVLDIIKETNLNKIYSSIFGKEVDVTLSLSTPYPIIINNGVGDLFVYSKDGKVLDSASGECLIFPSKDERDWNTWYEKWKEKHSPKTWNGLYPEEDIALIKTRYTDTGIFSSLVPHNCKTTPEEKSAKALIKIRKLIEECYGGNVTNNEWSKDIAKYVIVPRLTSTKLFNVSVTFYNKSNIAFHTSELAGEFLSYPENVQLLKDFYMIND